MPKAWEDAFPDKALHRVSTEMRRHVLVYNLQRFAKIVEIVLMMQAMGD